MNNLGTAIKNASTGKSKTINFNALITALIPVAAALGYPIPEAAIPAIYSIGNIIIRFLTTQALGEKQAGLKTKPKSRLP